MNEEYLIAKLMHNCNLSYEFAQSVVIDLSRRNLLEDLAVNIDKYEDYLDIFNDYYRGYLTKGGKK